MFRTLIALWDTWKERQEERWKDQLLETETDKQVEAVRSSVMDTNVDMILKKAELLKTNAKFILAKARKEGNNEHTRDSEKRKSKGSPV